MSPPRGRRAERREDRRDDQRIHYRMRERLMSIGDDFWIEDDSGRRAFKVDGKALRVRKTLVIEDASGHEMAKIQEQMMRLRDSMEIEGPTGDRMAVVRKAMITPLRERFTVDVADGADLEIQGNLVDHEYRFERGRDTVAEVSKRWFRVADTYGVEIAPDEDPVLILSATVAVDAMVHP